MLLTIGIPSYNRPTAANDAIRNLMKLNLSDSCAVFLANNGSSQEYSISAQGLNKNLTFNYIKFETNLGFALNLLRLIEHCESKYILFMSDEDDLQDNNISHLTEFLIREEPTVVILKQKGSYNKKNKPLRPKKVKGVSSYLSGIIINKNILNEYLPKLEELIQNEEYAYLYPQVLIVAILNSVKSGYLMKSPTYLKRVNLPSSVMSKNGNSYWLPTERVMQHISLIRCLAELSNFSDPATSKNLLKISESINRKFFGLIYDSIKIIAPELAPIFVRSSFKTAIFAELKLVIRKIGEIPKIKFPKM